jgi:flagellar motility protein MotE (MotC chaperone)
MASEDSIQKLVKDTQVYLAGVWDALGTADDERNGAVNKLFGDLEQVLMGARQQADEDKDRAETKRAGITDEINAMATCMEVEADLPEQGGKGILQHIEALEARAEELASLKTDRKEQIDALCEEATGLFADIGVNVEVSGCKPVQNSRV